MKSVFSINATDFMKVMFLVDRNLGISCSVFEALWVKNVNYIDVFAVKPARITVSCTGMMLKSFVRCPDKETKRK